MDLILNLAGDSLRLVIAVLVLLSGSVFAYAVMNIGSSFMQGYKETFTESASANMSDMFLTIDATRLFYLNLIAIVFIPLTIWVLLGYPITAFALFALLAFLPGIMYRRIRNKRLRRFEEQLPDGLLMLSGAMRAGAS